MFQYDQFILLLSVFVQHCGWQFKPLSRARSTRLTNMTLDQKHTMKSQTSTQKPVKLAAIQ